ANELGPRKIRVNTVSPSLTETEGTHSAGMLASEFEAGIVTQTPLGRLGQPQDIADVVAFVASDDARWVTGGKISAGGGLRWWETVTSATARRMADIPFQKWSWAAEPVFGYRSPFRCIRFGRAPHRLSVTGSMPRNGSCRPSRRR
ncbi:SDR family oxidoreductase, partial [Mycoplasmoides pneumoniae]